MTTLDYARLSAAVGGTAAGLRVRTPLEPLGGPGDKIFPPTYGLLDDARTKYATERRRIDGVSVEAVVVDSVASQANRMEQALLETVRTGELTLPLVTVDFRDQGDLAGLDRITSLDAPHRVFDAVLRDSLHGDVFFRLSAVGQAITEATHHNAAALFRYNPATLLFGGWDSTGPKGGRGSRYERAITSEIVALGIELGVKTASRLDAVGIERRAGPLYEAKDQSGWTLDPSQAATDKDGNPRLLTGGGQGAAGRPAHANHGNVPPTIDKQAGGVTADRIEATTVLSFAALRRFRFPTDTSGGALPDEGRPAAEAAAWTALAALGIAATVLAFDGGHDLRSRCVLMPTGPLEFELLGRAGEVQRHTVTRSDALELVREAVRRAAELGLAWEEEEVVLRPTDRLMDLIRRSRDLAVAEPVEE